MGIYLPSVTEIKCPAGSSPKSQAIKQKDALSASVYNLRHAHPSCLSCTHSTLSARLSCGGTKSTFIHALDIISDPTYANILAVGTSYMYVTVPYKHTLFLGFISSLPFRGRG